MDTNKHSKVDVINTPKMKDFTKSEYFEHSTNASLDMAWTIKAMLQTLQKGKH